MTNLIVANRKWLHKKSAFLLAAVVLVATCTGVFFYANFDYWQKPYLDSEIPDTSALADVLREKEQETEAIEEQVQTYNETATALSSKENEFVEGCNSFAKAYFFENYGVDISEKIATLTVQKVIYPEDISQMVGGSFYPEKPNHLFINADWFYLSDYDARGTDYSATALRNVYVHELMHFLGFHSGLGMNYFTEAVAESLTERIMNDASLPYERMTGYAGIQQYASDFIECDPEFIRGVLSDGCFDLKGRIDTQIGAAYSDYYNLLIGSVQHNGDRALQYRAKHITYEYCKASDANFAIMPPAFHR